MLQVEHGTRTKSVEKLRINLGTAYGIVLGQCTDYMEVRREDGREGAVGRKQKRKGFHYQEYSLEGSFCWDKRGTQHATSEVRLWRME